MRNSVGAICLVAVLQFQAGGLAIAADGDLCRQAIQNADGARRTPPTLLESISLVESGRPDPRSGRVLAWPWTINIEGAGYFFASKAEAIAAVEAARSAGKTSIDVGCMQINLQHHSTAFATLEEAFDPTSNVRYAMDFLSRLFQQTGSWPAATGAYHSFTPSIGGPYRDRVLGLGQSKLGDAKEQARPLSALERAAAADRTPRYREMIAEQASDRSHLRLLGFTAAPERTSNRRMLAANE